MGDQVGAAVTSRVNVYMPLVIGDYVKDTLDLTTEEHGAYFLLLISMWNAGGELPDDPQRLAALAKVSRKRWPVLWATIGRFFMPAGDGKVTQKRLKGELEAARGRSRVASVKGKRGNDLRWSGHRSSDPPAIPQRSQGDRSSSSSSSSGREEEKRSGSLRDPSPPLAAGEAEKVRAVFGHYRLFHPRAFPDPKPAGKEWRLIKSRLAEGHGVDDLKTCIDGYHRSPFHTGENERGAKYLDLELMVRDGSHVAKGIDMADQRAGPVLTPKETKGVRAGLSWLERTKEPDAEP